MNGAGTLATTKPPLAASHHSDPWGAVISSLKGDATHEPSNLDEIEADPLAHRAGRDCTDTARRGAAADRARGQPAPAKSANVTFVERFTAKSVSITWRDSTAANYCEQLSYLVGSNVSLVSVDSLACLYVGQNECHPYGSHDAPQFG